MKQNQIETFTGIRVDAAIEGMKKGRDYPLALRHYRADQAEGLDGLPLVCATACYKAGFNDGVKLHGMYGVRPSKAVA
jgi:hypothetical protein